MKIKSPFFRQVLFFKLTIITVLILFLITFVQGNVFFEKIGNKVSSAKAQVESVTVADLADLMDKNADITVLDIRTEAEYSAGHLNGAVWIPRCKLEFMAGGKLPSTDQEIIVYCRVDSRSALAAAILKEMGFKNAKYLQGGFMYWTNEGHSIFNRHGELIVKAFEKREKI